MKLAGAYLESLGYPLDDAPLMVGLALRNVLASCRHHRVEPVGAFRMSIVDSHFGAVKDRALAWEFIPADSHTMTHEAHVRVNEGTWSATCSCGWSANCHGEWIPLAEVLARHLAPPAP